MELSDHPSPALSIKHPPVHPQLCLSDRFSFLKAFWHRRSQGAARHGTCPLSGAARAQPQAKRTDPDTAGGGGARLRGIPGFTSPRPSHSASRSDPDPFGNSGWRQPVLRGQAQRSAASALSRPSPVLPVERRRGWVRPLHSGDVAQPSPAADSHPSAARQPGGQRPGA